MDTIPPRSFLCLFLVAVMALPAGALVPVGAWRLPTTASSSDRLPAMDLRAVVIDDPEVHDLDSSRGLEGAGSSLLRVRSLLSPGSGGFASRVFRAFESAEVEAFSRSQRAHEALAGPDRGGPPPPPFEDVALSLGWQPRPGLRLSVDYGGENFERRGHGSVVMLRLSLVR